MAFLSSDLYLIGGIAMIKNDIENVMQRKLPKIKNNDQFALTLQTIESMKEKGVLKKPIYPIPPLNTIGESNNKFCCQQEIFRSTN